MNRLKALFTGNWHFNLFYGLLLLAMLTLPLTNWLMIPIAILMFLNWITEWNWRDKWNNLKSWQGHAAFICFTLLYIMLIPGLLMSCNKTEAWAAFDCELWILAAPLFLLTTNPKKLSSRHLQTAFGVFTLGIVVHILIILSIAIYKFFLTGKTYYFYYSTLSTLIHPSYVAMYATFGYLFVLQMLSKFWKEANIGQRVLGIALIGILVIAVILLQSKAGLLCFFLLTGIWIIHYFIRKKKILIGISILGVLLLGGIFLYQSGWIEKNRLMESVEQVRNRKENPYGTDSSEMRLTLWKCTSEVIREKMPWGVGTGDATQEINLHALKKNYTNVMGHHYNAHCQYLQTLLEIGVLGLAALLCFCIYPIYFSIKKRNLLYFSFAIMVVLNITVECMLKVRSGVDFIALGNSMLFLYAFQQNKES